MRFRQGRWNGREGETCAMLSAPPRMPLPPDDIFVSETPESPEDLFPSENQETVRVLPTRAVYTRGRRFAVLTIALFVRWFGVLMTASRLLVRLVVASSASAASSLRVLRLPRWRLPALRLPAWRVPALRLPSWHLPKGQLPKWQLPEWQLPKWQLPKWQLPKWQLPRGQLPKWQLPTWQVPKWRLPSWQLPAWQLPRWQTPEWRDGAWSITVSAFACGVVVGGLAVWLMGASRQPAVESTAPQRTPSEVARATGSSGAPVATAFANPPVVKVADAAPAAG